MAALRAVVIFVGRGTRRVVVTLIGVCLVMAGVVMMVTPGPGWLGVVAGLAVLSTEYVWARVALEKARQRARQTRDRVRERRRSAEEARRSPEEAR